MLTLPQLKLHKDFNFSPLITLVRIKIGIEFALYLNGLKCCLDLTG